RVRFLGECDTGRGSHARAKPPPGQRTDSGSRGRAGGIGSSRGLGVADTTGNIVIPPVRERGAARRCDMRTKRRWLAGLTAALGVALSGLTGCQTWYGGMTLPSPRYLQHYPQYFAPDPAFPLPREQASMEDPEGLARRG